MNGYGYGYDYGYYPRSTTYFVPYYIDPWYENLMYQRMKKEQRYQNYLLVWSVRREANLDARYRNRMRLNGININMYDNRE